VGELLLLSFLAALSPTLLAATTVMLLLPSPSRLMMGYLVGALLISITLGLVIVFSLKRSSAVSTTQHTLSPAADMALGTLALAFAVVLVKGGAQRLSERRSGRRPPKWRQTLSTGSPRTTFVLGAVLALPGASYLAGLDHLSKLHYSAAATVLVVIGVNVVMLVMLEVPLISFAVAPEWTPTAVDRAKTWAAAHGQRVAARGLAVIGAALVVRGVLGLL
jgi:hypothetical protein